MVVSGRTLEEGPKGLGVVEDISETVVFKVEFCKEPSVVVSDTFG